MFRNAIRPHDALENPFQKRIEFPLFSDRSIGSVNRNEPEFAVPFAVNWLFYSIW